MGTCKAFGGGCSVTPFQLHTTPSFLFGTCVTPSTTARPRLNKTPTMPAEADYEDREYSDRHGAPPPPSSGTRPLPADDSDEEIGSKRKHKKKDKDERASKRHKEHKKHKKHKKDRDDGSSEDEKERQNGRHDEDRSPEDRKRDSPRRGSPLRNRSQDRSPQYRERRRSRSP